MGKRTNRKTSLVMSVFLLAMVSTAAGRTITVDDDGPADFNNIQAAIDDSGHGDKIIVAEGTYYENINFKGKNIILRGTDPEDPDVVAATIIDGGQNDSVVIFHGGENSRCVLKGFTITGGRSGICGGGIRGYGSTATVSRCVITGNWAGDDGGGLSRCDGEIRNCVITDNRACTRGAGLAYCDGSITNCIISNNWGCEGGGGLWCCDGRIINCTIANNQVDYYSAGLRGCDGPIVNCIIWGNIGGNPLDQCSTPSYSCIHGWTGEGNIDADPCFVDPGYWHDNGTPDYPWDDYWVEGDYHLLPRSPCIDAGDNTRVTLTTDLDGNPRIIGDAVDMGAYEYSGPLPAELRIIPRTINLTSKGKWITCHIWLPEGYNVADIDSHSLLLEFLDKEIEPEQFWFDEEKQVAMARFDRSEVQSILNIGDADLTISGQLTDGTVFEATDTIRVIDKGGGKSAK